MIFLRGEWHPTLLLWPNGWMDDDATWYGSRSWFRPHDIRWGPSSSHEGGTTPPLFSSHVYCGHGRPSQLLLSFCCTAHGRESLLYNGPPLLPLKIAHSHGWIWTPSNTPVIKATIVGNRVTGAVRCESGQIRTVPVRSLFNRTVAVRVFGFYTSYDSF